jgi:tetratricopeptide (TPR) repeat protein
MARFKHLASAAALSLALLAPTFAAAQDDPLKEARTALALSKYEVAEAALAKASATDTETLYLKTRLFLFTGRYAEAVRTARRARGKRAIVKLAPWHAEALIRQGKRDEAMTVLQTVSDEEDAHRARLVLGELLIARGKRAEARTVLMELVAAYNADRIGSDDAEGLSLVARGAYLLRAYRDANDAFNEAERAGAKKRVETLLWRAELFLDKYDPGHAGSVTKEAAKLSPDDPQVKVMLAKVKLAQTMDFAAAEELVAEVLAVDPKLAGAHVVRAGLALRNMDIEAADKALDAGLAVDAHNLELLSMKAAVRFLAEDQAGFAAVEKKILALNPEFSRLYSIVGEFAEWEHRYEEIVDMMGRAVAVDPKDGKAFAQLGLNLIRNGDDAKGLEALKKAWRRDKFNVRVYNTLNLYEETIPQSYVSVDGTTFKLRYHKKEKAVLERYVPRMLDEAWGSMVKRYGFKPKTPVGIELYADAQHFSIRTSGLPNVGIQGVCFGHTLAALSPGAGSFNWGMILWHELAHVFHIQQSKNRVPRWFTEGLAEYETIIQRPEWQREEHLALFHGLRDGKIPKVASFNRAFTHVDSSQDIVMAYFAASQISVFLAEEFGFDKVVKHLPLWAAGKRTPEVVQTALGISADELDRRYRAWLEKKLTHYDRQFVPDLSPAKSVDVAREAVAKDPSSAKALVKLAVTLLASGKGPEAKSTLSLALAKDAKHRDARYLQLRLALGEEDVDAAKRIVDGLMKDADGYAVRMKAADIAEAKEDKDGMRKHFFKAHRFDPLQAEPLQALYDLAKKSKDSQGQLWALRELAKLDQHDRRVWGRLLDMLMKRGKWEEARKVGESAIFIDVMNPELHWLYGRALARTGQFVSAIYEMNSALLANASPALAAKIYTSMAEGYDKLGKKDFAAKARKYATQVGALSTPIDDGGGLRD